MMSENNADKKENIPNRLLRRAREGRGWTQEDVARLLDLPDTRMMRRWEHGEHKPHLHYQQKLCQLFEKSPQELGFIKEHKVETPALAAPALSEVLWNVPTTFTSFVGREQEITAIQALLVQPDVRLITLAGPGGVGKTRLAIQVALAEREHFSHGVCFVSLESIRDPSLIPFTIAEVLGIQPIQPLDEIICMFLYERQLLLILDNFEQVAQASPLLECILRACPSVKMLVTSRVMLHISAERKFPVEPLPRPDLTRNSSPEVLLQQPAVELFIQRAKVVQPDFSANGTNARNIAEICTHLDGLPLAIELAAARMKLLTPHDLLVRLPRLFRLLKSDMRVVPDRQKTL
ncbi:MAG TPA: NB-ARC domain-containing protein, partial [Ktedonobacteraceae bacterium]